MNTQLACFFTATILDWKPLFNNNKYKKIILDSMSYLVSKQRCEIFGFVIMPNHIHVLWRMCDGHKKQDVQRDFLKFTGQMIKMNLGENDSVFLKQFYVGKKDREYQIWQRNSLSVEMYSREIMEQKLEYIHNNPVQGKWMLADDPLQYKYSSVRYYEMGDNTEYPFIAHYMNCFE